MSEHVITANEVLEAMKRDLDLASATLPDGHKRLVWFASTGGFYVTRNDQRVGPLITAEAAARIYSDPDAFARAIIFERAFGI